MAKELGEGDTNKDLQANIRKYEERRPRFNDKCARTICNPVTYAMDILSDG